MAYKIQIVMPDVAKDALAGSAESVSSLVRLALCQYLELDPRTWKPKGATIAPALDSSPAAAPSAKPAPAEPSVTYVAPGSREAVVMQQLNDAPKHIEGYGLGWKSSLGHITILKAVDGVDDFDGDESEFK